MDRRRCLEPALFRLFPIRLAASAGPQSLPVSGNLWPVLSLESVESTETQEHGVQCQLDILGSPLLSKDGDNFAPPV